MSNRRSSFLAFLALAAFSAACADDRTPLEPETRDLPSLAKAAKGKPTPVSACSAINAPGKYVLVADLTCGASGIQIRAGDVSLHLDGHTIEGLGGGVGVGLGWGVPGGVDNVHVHGPGTVRGFTEGIKLQQATGSSIRGLVVTGAGTHGMTVQRSQDAGIVSSDNAFHDNVFTANGLSGVLANGAADNVFRGNTFSENGRDGVTHTIGGGNDFRGNAFLANDRDGLLLGGAVSGNHVQGNTALGNGVFDLRDQSGTCAVNTWKGNTFGTAFPSCIE